MKLLSYFILLALIFITHQNCAEKEYNKADTQQSQSNLPPPSPEATKLSGGYNSICYLKNNAMKCWGQNTFGQLGNGSSNAGEYIPQTVIGLQAGVSYIDAGMHIACAIKNGGLYCWGYNRYGQLGNNENSDSPKSNPAAVVGLDSNVAKVSAGDYTTCALKTNGALYCWGYNGHGEIGDGSNVDKNVPSQVFGMSSGVSEVTTSTGDAREGHTCVIKNGGAFCWGSNSYGQVGNGSTVDVNTPSPVAGMEQGITQIAAGGYHTCAIKNSKLYCWGDNYRGQLGIGDLRGEGVYNARSAPNLVGGILAGKTISEVKLGRSHTCAIADGKLYCWGMNYDGQLGLGDTSDRSAPSEVIGVNNISALTCSAWSTHIYSNGSLYSWGFNDALQLGVNDTQRRLSPTKAFNF